MAFVKPDENYWNNKMIAYFHDPIDKVFDIPSHEERGAEILDIFGLQKPNEPFWKKADGIASGFERGQVPSFSKEPLKNGAINFVNDAVISHPTSKEDNQLKIDLSNIKAKDVFEELKSFLAENIGDKPGTKGFSNKSMFRGKPEKFAFARFLYSHLAIRFKLAEDEVGGLGALWHRLPADSRFPDHTIWQHNALVSAMSSCMGSKVEGLIDDVGMMVFSITPVQPFISKARKLRDYWTGSVILSWLAFEGIKWVIENLGCDHILYPSLIDQPLVNEYMKTQGVAGAAVGDELNFLNKQNDIASFPNKFLFLLPFKDAGEIADEIKKAVQNAWIQLGDMISKELMQDINATEEERKMLAEIFDRQFLNYWDFNWSCSPLLSSDNKDEIKTLLPKSSYERNFKFLDISNKIIEDKIYYEKSGKGALYSVTHSLVQTALAAGKSKRTVKRASENGEKCQMCGEFEVLNTFNMNVTDKIKAKDYSDNIKSLWDRLSKKHSENEIKSNEHLCAICLTKRLGAIILKDDKQHILLKTFKSSKSFPSTTEIALHDYFIRNETPDEDRKSIAQKLHEKENDDSDIRDRYYAILMMDGDKMGALVNGETIASSWETITHPEMIKRLKTPGFEKKYAENWEILLNDDNKKRLLTPSIHASISESLGDFAIYGAASIVKKYDGRLIYAGGDDVCAVMPVSTVLEAADEIQKYYTSTFKLIEEGAGGVSNTTDLKSGKNCLQKGKLSVNLGKGEGISISAGVLIAHHKDNLSGIIEEAHLLLDKAKSVGGRNAVAVQLRKRSGGSRYFVSKWDDKRFEVFRNIGGKIGDELSRSLVYRLSEYKDGTNAMLGKDNYEDLMIKFISLQLSRSGVTNEKKREDLAKDITTLSVIKYKENNKDKMVLDSEPLIIAAFIGNKGGEI